MGSIYCDAVLIIVATLVDDCKINRIADCSTRQRWARASCHQLRTEPRMKERRTPTLPRNCTKQPRKPCMGGNNL